MSAQSRPLVAPTPAPARWVACSGGITSCAENRARAHTSARARTSTRTTAVTNCPHQEKVTGASAKFALRMATDCISSKQRSIPTLNGANLGAQCGPSLGPDSDLGPAARPSGGGRAGQANWGGGRAGWRVGRVGRVGLPFNEGETETVRPQLVLPPKINIICLIIGSG